jgi:two-component system, OmpR family, sensor histidine kinase BaeS
MTLTRKLTLAFLLVAVTAAAIVAVFIRLTNTTRLNDLILEQQRADYATVITNYYQQTGSLAGLNKFLSQSNPRNQQQPNQQAPVQPYLANPPPGAPDRRNLFGFANAQGIVVVPLGNQFIIGQSLPPDVLKINQPLEVNGVLIGTILTQPSPIDLTPQEQAYLQRTNEALTYAALGAALLALIVGFLLARTLTRPLHALTEATEKMAAGELDQQVSITSLDEIGELAESFNRMSRQVAHANRLRKQMTADVAHDLRTPLTVIAGYVESMRDGDLDPTPERLETIYGEIERLQSLVQDLHLLAVTDAGELRLNLAPLDPRALLERVTSSFQLSAEQKGLTLRLEIGPDLPELNADEARLDRVLSNLITNSIRHTHSGSVVTIKATRIPPDLVLSVEDTGEGISPADLPHIFDRFYRVDVSRTDADGASSGLGLAIARALVEAHGGRITAESEPGKGTKITISLPV